MPAPQLFDIFELYNLAAHQLRGEKMPKQNAKNYIKPNNPCHPLIHLIRD
jgi:hypothetical protein